MAKNISGRDGKAGNPELGGFSGGHVPNAPGKLQSRRVEEHSFQHLGHNWGDHVSRLDFPASRDQLVEQARAHGMGDEMIEALQHMPNSHYASFDELRQGLGWEP